MNKAHELGCYDYVIWIKYMCRGSVCVSHDYVCIFCVGEGVHWNGEYVSIHLYVNVYVCSYVCVDLHINIYVWSYACVDLYINVYVCIYVCVDLFTNVYVWL